eukprot:8810795-Pyramimonas_sp.AAC.1
MTGSAVSPSSTGATTAPATASSTLASSAGALISASSAAGPLPRPTWHQAPPPGATAAPDPSPHPAGR